MPNEQVEKQARALASENRKAEPTIERVYWFPDEEEVRLVGVTPTVPQSDDGDIHPFYFRADPGGDLPMPSGIALIRPQEVGKLRLPRKWGDWLRAVALD
jgi:hypothetical protein